MIPGGDAGPVEGTGEPQSFAWSLEEEVGGTGGGGEVSSCTWGEEEENRG